MLYKDVLGNFEYLSIINDSIGIVSQIEFTEKDAYFLTYKNIIIISLTGEHEPIFIKSKIKYPFNVLIPFKNNIYVDDSSQKLKKIEGNKLKDYIDFPYGGKVLFAVRGNEKECFIGTTDNLCYFFDGKAFNKFNISDQNYLNDGKINDAVLLSKYIIISTNNSGCLVVEKKTGNTVFYLNYKTGLPDDEIYALNVDQNSGIWLAHYYGLSRIDLGLPVKNYTFYKGLSGKIQSIELFNNKIYVATNEGVYYLKEIQSYEVVNKPMTKETKKESEKIILNQPKQTKPEPSKEQPKKGFFSKLFGKREKPETKKDIEEEITPVGTKKKEIIKKPTKTYRVTATTYEFVKINGINKKCRQLSKLDNYLLAFTSDEIFSVEGVNAKKILSNVHTNNYYIDNKSKTLYVAAQEGLKTIFKDDKLTTGEISLPMNEPVFSLIKFNNKLWLGMENKVMVLDALSNSPKKYKIYELKNKQNERFLIRNIKNTPVIILSDGWYTVKNDTLVKYNSFLNNAQKSNLGEDSVLNKELEEMIIDEKTKIYTCQQKYTWFNKNDKWFCYRTDTLFENNFDFLNLFENISFLYLDSLSNIWLVDNDNLYKIDRKNIKNLDIKYNLYFKKLMGNKGKPFPLEGVILKPNENFIKLTLSAPYYLKPNSNYYSFFVDKLMHEWSIWSNSPEINLTLPAGKWTIHAKARNIIGIESDEKILTITIKKPFYNQWWFYLLCVVIAAFFVWFIIKIRVRQLQKEKEILEEKVRERTKQIEEQKEEILSQRDALSMQNILITEQKNKIVLINKEITDSIKYARRLQISVIPDDRELNQIFEKYFVIYKPKDIVSGDFYWAKKVNSHIYLAVADCTGHGVPGGFLTMLGISFLNEIFSSYRNIKANEMLNILRTKIKSILTKESQEYQTQDGMDISLCIIDTFKRHLQFAGANSTIYHLRNGSINEIKGDKMPIGLYLAEKESFTNIEINLEVNDEIILFSDGYKDQLGGEDGKRMKSHEFKRIILEVQRYPLEKQKFLMEQHFESWKGQYDQVDDILVFGVKI